MHDHDQERRLLRYRGRPHICNACPRKRACTDSEDGREIVQLLDDWPRLEVGRFHRGLAAMLAGLAALISSAALIRHHEALETAALGGLLVVSLMVGAHLAPPGSLGRRGGALRTTTVRNQ